MIVQVLWGVVGLALSSCQPSRGGPREGREPRGEAARKLL